MDADSTPPLKIHLPTSLPGSSVPIRAPLTIDSDSEFCLSINDQICSRASSFNSTSSSIDVSSVLEEDDGFVAYPDEEMVIESCRVEEHSFTRPFVKYPDENYVKTSSDFDKSAIFRPFVKYPDENYVKIGSHFDKSAIFRPFVNIPLQESSSVVNDFGIFSPIKLGMPVAPLTTDFDSDNDSVESRRSLSSGGIPDDGTVQKVGLASKVRVFCSYEGDDEVDDELEFDDVFSGDIHELNDRIKDSVSAKTIEEDEHKMECFNEVVEISEMDEIGLQDEQKEGDEDDTSFDSLRIDSNIVPDSDYEIGIEIETINGSKHGGVFDRYRNESKKTNEKEEQREEDEDDISFDSQKVDAQIVSDSENEIEFKIINEIEQGVFDLYRNEYKKTNEKEEEQRDEDEDDISFDSQTINAQIVSDSDNKIEIEPIYEIEQGVFDLYRNESKKSNEKDGEQREEDEDDISFDSQRIDAQIIPHLDNEIEIETMNEIQQEGVFDHFTKSQKTLGENEEEMLVKTQPMRPKFPNFDFSLTILVIGKTGAGKSATINSIFRENKSYTDAFCPGTTTVQEIVGKIDGIRVRILDTPGLRDSPSEQSYNRKILTSVKRFTRKRTPDIVLYVDRLDTHSRDLHDSCLLRLITSSLGSSVWQNCVVVLTHSSYLDSLPDESLGGFVFQRCRFIQEQIAHLRPTGQQTVNPVWLVENQSHPSYKHDQNWQTRFLLLCCSAKILHEADSVVEPSPNSLERDWFEFGDHIGHVMDLEAGLEGLMGSDRVRTVEPLGKPWNGGKIMREHKKAYFEDYDYCVKVFGMKRWSLVCRLHF